MNQNKTVPILLTIIALLFVSILIFLAVYLPKSQSVPVKVDIALIPTTEPTLVPTKSTSSIPSNWKTYTNSKYGFTINYPPTAVMDDKFDPRNNYPANYLLRISLLPDKVNAISIENFDNLERLSAKDYFDKENQITTKFTNENNVPPAPDVVDKKQQMIGNINAYSVEFNTHIDGNFRRYYIPIDDKIYILQYSIDIIENDSQVNEHNQLFDQIISTFKSTQ